MTVEFKNDHKTLIAIPIFNAEEDIEKTIISCLNQSIKSNILIVDNCSTDGSVKKITTYLQKSENIYLIKNTKNLGRVQNWNKCLEIFYNSNHNYLRFLFTGDTIEKLCIEESQKIFENNQDISILLSSYFFKYSENFKSISKLRISEGKYNLRQLIEKGLYPSRFSGPLVRNSFNKAKMKNIFFNENFHGTATFTNELVNFADLYYTEKVLCTFEKNSRKNFHKEHDFSVNIERLYTSILAIDKLDKFSLKKNKMKRMLIFNFFVYILKYKFPPSTFLYNIIKKVYYFFKKL